MSIIAGIVHLDGERLSNETCYKMISALGNYPVDVADTWQQGAAFFAGYQQWVTPESLHERMPLYDAERQLVLVSDAIIDNRLDLFNKLQVELSLREQMTDSEIILLAYRKWGEQAPQYLIGDFAFIVWDERNNSLFGARDLLGSRSLYFYSKANKFAFSSVMRPLLEMPDVERKLHESWLAQYLAIPSMIESSETMTTVYRDIQQLPPGHSIHVVAGRVDVRAFGTLIPENEIRFKSEGDYLEAFREVFHEAVNSRLRSYKQVGAALSGGLDSTAVVSVAARSLRESKRVMHAYSMIPAKDFVDWTSKNELADESPYIQATIDYVGNIKGRYLDAPNKSPYTEIDELLDIFESPYKNFEATFRIKEIYEQSKQDGVGVFLTGARGNYTISWGSAVDFYALLIKKLRFVRFFQELSLFSSQTGVGITKILPVIKRQLIPQAESNAEHLDMPSLINPDFASRTDVYQVLRQNGLNLSPGIHDVLQERQNYFNNQAVLSLQGTTGAKLSMRHKVWERDPTCDARLVRFCLAVPFEQYVHGGIGRSLVRRVTEGQLPDEVRMNQRVRGAQGVDWFHRILPQWSEISREVRQLCEDKTIAEILDTRQVRSSLEQLGESPKPEDAANPHAKIVMQSVITSRFLKQFI